MSNIEIINGDLLNATETIIAHQVNCLGVMGAGVAKGIKSKYPNVFKVYKKYTKQSSPSELLGQNLMISENGIIIDNEEVTGKPVKIISNLYGQNTISTRKQQTDMSALDKALKDLFDFAKINQYSIALPYKIGCGLGGGNWDDVLEIIKRSAGNYPVSLYKIN